MGWLSVFPLAQVPKNSYKECKTKFSIDVEFRISFNHFVKVTKKFLHYKKSRDIISQVKNNTRTQTLCPVPFFWLKAGRCFSFRKDADMRI